VWKNWEREVIFVEKSVNRSIFDENVKSLKLIHREIRQSPLFIYNHQKIPTTKQSPKWNCNKTNPIKS